MNSVVKLQRFKIEKQIPIPKPRLSPELYPFMDMLVGDSFLVPSGKPSRTAAQLRRSWHRFIKQNKEGGYEFAARIVKDGVRCWRTK